MRSNSWVLWKIPFGVPDECWTAIMSALIVVPCSVHVAVRLEATNAKCGGRFSAMSTNTGISDSTTGAVADGGRTKPLGPLLCFTARSKPRTTDVHSRNISTHRPGGCKRAACSSCAPPLLLFPGIIRRQDGQRLCSAKRFTLSLWLYRGRQAAIARMPNLYRCAAAFRTSS